MCAHTHTHTAGPFFVLRPEHPQTYLYVPSTWTACGPRSATCAATSGWRSRSTVLTLPLTASCAMRCSTRCPRSSPRHTTMRWSILCRASSSDCLTTQTSPRYGHCHLAVICQNDVEPVSGQGWLCGTRFDFGVFLLGGCHLRLITCLAKLMELHNVEHNIMMCDFYLRSLMYNGVWLLFEITVVA